jgi:hypothetical protein
MKDSGVLTTKQARELERDIYRLLASRKPKSKKVIKEELMSNCGWTWAQIKYYRQPNVTLALNSLVEAGRVEQLEDETYRRKSLSA